MNSRGKLNVVYWFVLSVVCFILFRDPVGTAQ